MNEETLKNLSREEAINYLDNQIDYTYQLQKRIDKAIDFIENRRSGHDWYDRKDLLEILKGDVDDRQTVRNN